MGVSKTFLSILGSIAVLLAGLIYLCRLRRAQGFIWLGVSVWIGRVILLALDALSITGFVLLRDRRMKKEAAAAQTALPEAE